MPTNDRLADALSAAGFSPHDVAARIGVDPKTVERWITQGRTPYPRHRREIAALVTESEFYLWPEALSPARRTEAAASEIVHVYPHRAGIPADAWTRLFSGASEHIDVLVYAALSLPEQQPKLMKRLCRQAENGTKIRFLLGDPDCEAVAQRGAEEGIGGAISAKIRNVLTFFDSHAEHSCVDVRLHRTTLYTSIYRFDREMLVNHHVLGLPAAHAPAMHLRQLESGDLFTTYTDVFERVWAGADPAWQREAVA
jgi:transcriptional regulator with XRE-family HTH domain